jgi:hypothetical protein
MAIELLLPCGLVATWATMDVWYLYSYACWRLWPCAAIGFGMLLVECMRRLSRLALCACNVATLLFLAAWFATHFVIQWKRTRTATLPSTDTLWRMQHIVLFHLASLFL